MAAQIEVPKVTVHPAIGAKATDAAVSKLVVFVLLTPGDSGLVTNRQAHVYSQIIRRG